eukprot:9202764-Alexandrium_andersonii.AAC.1
MASTRPEVIKLHDQTRCASPIQGVWRRFPAFDGAIGRFPTISSALGGGWEPLQACRKPRESAGDMPEGA